MKKLLSAVLTGALLLGLCACGNAEPESAETTEAAPNYTASQAEIDQLEKLYEGRIPLHGEFHNHASTGGTSDGKVDLADATAMMQHIAGWKNTTIDEGQADVNDDGYVTLADVSALMKKIAGWK